MTTLGSDPYAVRSRWYLEQASEELERGDILQASEKGWGAASQMLKAVAEQRGWRHRNHNDLYKAIDQAIAETDDLDLRFLFSAAGELHSNFYEEFLSSEAVRDNLIGIGRFVDKMEALLDAR